MGKSNDYNEKRKNFLHMLQSVSKEQLSEFIKAKGREPKKIKPFICLDNQ